VRQREEDEEKPRGVGKQKTTTNGGRAKIIHSSAKEHQASGEAPKQRGERDRGKLGTCSSSGRLSGRGKSGGKKEEAVSPFLRGEGKEEGTRKKNQTGD